MRKKYFIIVLTAMFIGLVSCEKPEKNPEPDYREKWVGDWEFVAHYSSYGMVTLPAATYYYSGKISLDNDSMQLNMPYISYPYKENISMVLSVDENGKLSGFHAVGGNHYSYGAFRGNDTLSIYLRSGGMGGGISRYIDGVKKKGGKAEKNAV